MSLYRRRWSGAVCAGASGILFALSLDMGPVGPLVLVAPIPVLLYAIGAERTGSVAGWAFATGLVARFSLLYAYFDVFPPAVLALWLCALPLWFMGIVLATRWMIRGGSLWAALLSYPMLTTASEFLFG
jgi:apolipoprotein N-acyltransferase